MALLKEIKALSSSFLRVRMWVCGPPLTSVVVDTWSIVKSTQSTWKSMKRAWFQTDFRSLSRLQLSVDNDTVTFLECVIGVCVREVRNSRGLNGTAGVRRLSDVVNRVRFLPLGFLRTICMAYFGNRKTTAPCKGFWLQYYIAAETMVTTTKKVPITCIFCTPRGGKHWSAPVSFSSQPMKNWSEPQSVALLVV